MHQNLRHRQRAQEFSLAIDHKQLIGMIGQRLKATQELQDDFKRDVLANRNHLKVHARTDAVFRIAHRRTQLRAFFMRQTFLNLGHHIWRQVVNQVSNLIRIEPFDGVNEFFAIHRVDQGLANAFAHFDQNVTFVLMTHKVPNRQTLFRRQGFENVGDIGRMQVAQNIGEFRLCRQIQRSGIGFLGIVARDLASVFLIFKDL